MRPLTLAQKDRLTSRLFMVCAVGSILTVAAPTLFPCPVMEQQKERDREDYYAIAHHEAYFTGQQKDPRPAVRLPSTEKPTQ
ncbi:hypothetical protein H4R33_001357 [Dimargaris cristalligena]|nr:hypothetical protein H4R33_001357 [Dimargaris cristalligena]